jgi:hypothetical protein
MHNGVRNRGGPLTVVPWGNKKMEIVFSVAADLGARPSIAI